MVVNLALLRVLQNFICFGDVLELLGSVWIVWVLVRVVSESALLVCGLELRFGGVRRDLYQSAVRSENEQVDDDIRPAARSTLFP